MTLRRNVCRICSETQRNIASTPQRRGYTTPLTGIVLIHYNLYYTYMLGKKLCFVNKRFIKIVENAFSIFIIYSYKCPGGRFIFQRGGGGLFQIKKFNY